MNITTDEITIRSLGQKQCDGNYTVERTETRPDVDFFIMHVNEPLLRECRYELVIPFKSELSKGLSGYYRSSYINKASQEKRYVLESLSTELIRIVLNGVALSASQFYSC